MRRTVVFVLATTCLLSSLSLAACSGGSSPRPVSPSTTASAETGTPATVASVAASPTPVLPRGIEITVDENGKLPPGIVVYYYGGDVPIEGVPNDIRRAYRTKSGNLYVERLYDRIGATGYVYTYAIDASTGRLAIALCTAHDCGGFISASRNAENTLYQSDDGGITWRVAGSLPFGVHLSGFADDGLIVYGHQPSGQTLRWWVYPNGREIPAPPGGTFLQRDDSGALVWGTSNGTYLDDRGVVRWAAFDAAAFGLPADRTRGNRPGYTYSTQERLSSVYRRWTLALDRAGNSVGAFWSDQAHVEVISPLAGRTVLANVHHDRPSPIGRAGLFDFATGQAIELSDLRGPGDSGAFARTAFAGSFAVVVKTGDCLNVRESPGTSGRVLGCFKDGTLLTDKGAVKEADGGSWLMVLTPSGQPGWASLQYLDR